MNPLKILSIILGFLFFGLGAVGAVLPVIPTVPFLLIASFFFARGSKRFDRWFRSTKLYQNHLESYLRMRVMTLKTKIWLTSLATVMLLISIIVVPIIPVKIFLLALIIFMYYYFARRIRTITPEERMIMLKEDEVWRKSHEPAPPISLRDTVHEVKEMHKEMHEEIREEMEAKSSPKRASTPPN